jgi:hypothetical protein
MALARIGAITAFGSVVKALQPLPRRRRLQDVATTRSPSTGCGPPSSSDQVDLDERGRMVLF